MSKTIRLSIMLSDCKTRLSYVKAETQTSLEGPRGN